MIENSITEEEMIVEWKRLTKYPKKVTIKQMIQDSATYHGEYLTTVETFVRSMNQMTFYSCDKYVDKVNEIETTLLSINNKEIKGIRSPHWFKYFHYSEG